MTQRGGPHNFLFKYAPLRLRGASQPIVPASPRVPTAQVPFSPQVLSRTPNSHVASPEFTDSGNAENSPSLLFSSLENIKNFCQHQERHNSEMQSQLDDATNEIGRLKAQLDSSFGEIEQLRLVNQKLRDSHHNLDEEIQRVCHWYTEIKTAAQDTAETLEEIAKDRESWLSNFEDMQRKHYDRRVKLLQSDFRKSIDEKETLLNTMRGDNERLYVQYLDAVAERDRLKEQYTETKSALDRIAEENLFIHQERNKFEIEWKQLKASFDKLLSEKIAHVVEESLQEKAKSERNANELNELRTKWTSLQDEYQNINSQLLDMKRLEHNEPRESLKAEIVSSREHIRQLNSVNDAKETEVTALRDKLTSIQQTLATFEDVKQSLNILSRERALLQDRYSLLEKECVSISEALVECKSRKDLIEITVKELNEKLEEECKKTCEKENEAQGLVKQLNSYQQMVEEKTTKLDELGSKLTISEERNNQLQGMLDEKVHSKEEILALEEKSQRLKADMEREIAELKNQLMAKSIELQYKEKRMEETEKALNELQSEIPGQDESTRSEAEMPKLKTKSEIEKLKTTVNLKNLELESVNDELREAQKTIASAERKITDLELTVTILERKLETERLQVSSNIEMSAPNLIKADKELDSRPQNNHSILKEPVSSHALCVGTNPITDCRPDNPVATQESGEKMKATIDNLETLALFQRASAMAKEEELKRNKNGSSSQIKKPPSPSSIALKPSEKRRRVDKDGSRASSVKIDLRDSVPESPVIRNNSGVRTSRFLSRSRSSSCLPSSTESPTDKTLR